VSQSVLLRASVPDDDIWDAPDFAAVRLDPATARHYVALVQQARELGRRHRDFYALSLFDYQPTWYEYLAALDGLLPADGRGWAILAPGRLAFLSFPRCQARIVRQGATTVQAMPDGVCWHGYIKHSPMDMETAVLPLAALRQIAYLTPRDLALSVTPEETAGVLEEAGWIGEQDQAAVERLLAALPPAYEQMVEAQEYDLAHAASTLRAALEQPESAAYLAVGLQTGRDPERLVTALTNVAIAFLDQERPWIVEDDAGGVYERDVQEWQGWLRPLLAGPLQEYQDEVVQ